MSCQNTIVIIVSQHCGYCRDLQTKLPTILKNYPQIKIKIFDVSDKKTLKYIESQLEYCKSRLVGVPDFFCERNNKFYQIPFEFKRYSEESYFRAANLDFTRAKIN